MRKFTLFLVGLIMFVGAYALAQVNSAQDAVTVSIAAAALWKSGKHLMAEAGLLMVLIYVFRVNLMPKLNISPKALPLLSALLGLIGGPLVAIYTGGDAHDAAMAALSGPLASTMWNAIVKYFVPEPKV